MAGAAGSWCLIESDPGVFTELIRGIGVKDVQVEEIYSLDEATFKELDPIYGLIFLFKWRSKEKDERPVLDDYSDRVFFASQVINNACATQAILSILMNCPQIDIGEELRNFLSFTSDFPAELKGLAISNSDKIREVHNSFARTEAFISEEKYSSGDDDDLYHFIAYVHRGGHLYELDGLKKGPIDLGECNESTWLNAATPVIQERINRYSGKEIRFNLMAVIKDRSSIYNERLADIELQINNAKAAISGGDDVMNGAIADLQHQAHELRERLAGEKDKMERYRVENIRRRHNYIPFFMEMLKLLAKKGELLPLVEKAKAKAAAGTSE